MFDREPRSINLFRSQLGRSLYSLTLMALCCACGGGTGPFQPLEPQVTFIAIDPLPGDVSSQATAVSADGTVVAGISKSASGRSQAFRWSAMNGVSGLGFMAGGTSSSARALCADGTVIVGDGNTQDASSAVFRWQASTGLVQLQALADSRLCAAADVSGDGQVVVGTCLTAGNSAFRWTDSTGMVALGQFGGGSNRTSNAVAISADASTVVGMGHPVLTGAVLWNAVGEASILGWLPGDISAAATAVSRNGSTVVGYSTQPSSHQRAFRWTPATGMSVLAEAAGSLSDVIASAVSGDARIVVGWGNTPSGETALLWDELHGLRRLEDVLRTDYQTTISGWTLARAMAVSDDGRTIAGFGTNPEGHVAGWVLKFSN